jgi:hypothetical protein
MKGITAKNIYREHFGKNANLKGGPGKTGCHSEEADIPVYQSVQTHQQEEAIDDIISNNMPDDQYELLVLYGVKHLKGFFVFLTSLFTHSLSPCILFDIQHNASYNESKYIRR